MLKLAVMGNPIAHSKSPILHQYFAQKSGIAIDYQRILVEPTQLAQAINNFKQQGGIGLNITVPFKQEVLQLPQLQMSAAVQLAQSANTLHFQSPHLTYADNTDGYGLCMDLERLLEQSLVGKTILIIGAGGACRGAIPALIHAGVRHIQITNRTLSKAEELAQLFNTYCQKHQLACEIVACSFDMAQVADIIINSSASSMNHTLIPLPADAFESAILTYDMFYTSYAKTFFLEQSKGRCADGLGMLIYQGLASFKLWTGTDPQIEFEDIAHLLRQN